MLATTAVAAGNIMSSKRHVQTVPHSLHSQAMSLLLMELMVNN